MLLEGNLRQRHGGDCILHAEDSSGVVGVQIEEGCPFNHIPLLFFLLDAALPKWRMRMDWKGRDEAKGMLCRPDEYTACQSITYTGVSNLT